MRTHKIVFLYIMSLLYISAGITHFLKPEFYLDIMPPYLPWHLKLVYFSGLCEILFGIMLIPAYTRRIAAWLIIALLIAVFPANIQMTNNYMNEHNPDLWISIIRLPVQIFLVWWAWIYTKTGKG
jgi:uncharacterized membrane protein